MQALIVGDIHGQIEHMYRVAALWERQSGRKAEAILQVGDFGVYPDPSRLTDKKLARYGPGDYARLAAQGWKAPVPTWFCRGNNEDFDALAGPLLPGLHWVPDGRVVTLGNTRVAFLGGGWAPKSYAGEPKPSHIRRDSVEALMRADFDILICHDAPSGTWLPGIDHPVGAPPLRELVKARRPRLVVHGHHHIPGSNRIEDIPVIGLGLLAPDRDPEGAILDVEL